MYGYKKAWSAKGPVIVKLEIDPTTAFMVVDISHQRMRVNQCKVVDIQTENGTELAAHIVFDETVGDSKAKLNQIATRVKGELPSYMVPQYYKIRTSIPVHANGKRDVGALRKDKDGLISADELR